MLIVQYTSGNVRFAGIKSVALIGREIFPKSPVIAPNAPVTSVVMFRRLEMSGRDKAGSDMFGSPEVIGTDISGSGGIGVGIVTGPGANGTDGTPCVCCPYFLKR